MQFQSVQFQAEKCELLYRKMATTRFFDEKLCALYPTNPPDEKPMSAIGQEASSIGTACALNDNDLVMPALRSVGVYFARNFTPLERFMEMYKREGCTSNGTSMPHHVGDVRRGLLWSSAIVSGTIIAAAGVALASKIRGDGKVMMAYFGDGGSSSADVAAAMNLAAVQNLPIVFVCENNLWALGTPFRCQSKHETIADRAAGYGIPGITVDGQDVISVYAEARKAVARARNGEGPTFLECKTYRFRGHSESHHPDDKRPKEELEYWRSRDPLDIYRKRLTEDKLFTQAYLSEIDAEIRAEVEAAAEKALALPKCNPPIELLAGNVYA